MSNIYLTKDDLKTMPLYDTNDINTEATLFRHLNYLYKIYQKKDCKEKEPIIDFVLSLKKIDHCIFPNGKIYLDKEFAGMRMDYLTKYKTLFQTLESKQINFKTRLQICREFIKIIKLLYEQDICYDDIDLHNVLINDSDVQLVDLDGSSIKEFISNDEYEISKNLMQFNSTILVISYLYRINFHEIINRYDFDYFSTLLYILKIDKELCSYISKLVAGKDVGSIYVDEYLETFDEEQIKIYKKGYLDYFIKKK